MYCNNIYKEDVAIEARKVFKKYFRYGSSDIEGIKVIKKYFPAVSDSDEGPVCTLILAEEMWKIGHLTPQIMNKAKNAAVTLLKMQKELLLDKDYIKYEKSVEQLLNTITSSQPTEKKINRIELYDEKWSVGDVILIESKKSVKITKQDVNNTEYSEIVDKYSIVFIIESTKDNIIIGYAKYSDLLREKNLKLSIDQINSLPYVEQKYRMHMLGIDQLKKCTFLGNYKSGEINSPPDDILNKQPFNLTFELVPLFAIKKYYSNDSSCLRVIDW